MPNDRRQAPALVVRVACILLLLWALYPENPYGYYLLLRWLCFGSFAYLAVLSWRTIVSPWPWVFGVAAGIYNPFLKLHLGRPLWTVVNIATIAVLIASFFLISFREKRGPEDER